MDVTGVRTKLKGNYQSSLIGQICRVNAFIRVWLPFERDGVLAR